MSPVHVTFLASRLQSKSMSRFIGPVFGILFRPLEEFVEFLLQHLAVRLLGLERLPEDLFAARAFALEFVDLGGEILDRPRPFGTLCAITAGFPGRS